MWFSFDAEMGTGKTTFIMGLLKAMGIEHTEGSPTYSLVNVYESQMFGKVFHFDLYRIKDEMEALDIGIEEMLYSDGVCLIEWPDRAPGALPNPDFIIELAYEEEGRSAVLKTAKQLDDRADWFK